MVIRKDEDRRAVFFIEGHTVSRQMLYSEFEAVLDGYASMPDYADRDMKAVYVVLNEFVLIDALVFFQIYFDEEGLADPSWNIPLAKLASISGRGPDLGGGAIRLACRGQCPINWHQKELWDPSMNPGANDLLAIKKAVKENRLKFTSEVSSLPTLTNDDAHAIGDIPVLMPDDFVDAMGDSIPVLKEATTPNESLTKRRAGDPDKRNKLARLIKDQRLRIRTLDSKNEEKFKNLAREHWVEIQSYKTQFDSLKQSIEQYRVMNDQLKKKLYQRNEQYLSLQDRLTEKSARLAVLEKTLEQAESGSRSTANVEKLEAELALVRERLDRREVELAYRDEREDQLRSELEEIKKHSGTGEDSGILSRLKELDVVFVAYHPGAGHVTISFTDIKRYSQNPIAFVASKCFVTEDQYMRWLTHYENPVCRYYSENGDVCGQTIKAVSIPSEFEEGVSDRCKLHDGSF